VVVGDRFAPLLGSRGVIGASELIARLRAGDLPPSLPIVVGQGIPLGRLEELGALLENRGGRISTDCTIPVRADRWLTHKHDLKNVMIGRPERLPDGRFVVDLVVDERNEMLEDHLTGQHIPAIALTEAARQTWTAVTTANYLEGKDDVRFLVSSVASSFHRYVFPLPATLCYELLSRTATAVGQTFECRVTVLQGGELAATIDAGYRTIWEPLCARQEAMAARQAMVDGLSRSHHVGDSTAARQVS
jgi:hypothetical protein